MSCSKLSGIFLLCFFLFVFPNLCLCAPKCDFIITKKDLSEMRKGRVYNSANTSGTACLKNYDNRGILFPIKNGKIEGTAVMYYYDDFIEETTPYKNSKREGIEKRYFPNGALLRSTPYKNDKIEGIEKIYYEIGGVESEIPYKNDRVEGIRKDYYMDGTLAARFSYKNDYKEGPAKKYYHDGQIKLERMYKMGRKHGYERSYTDEGIMTEEIPFYEGSVNGTLKVFDKETGKPFLFVDFIKGIKHGKAVKYSADGKVYAVINFENDYAVSGKCSNGYKLTPKDLETIQFSIYRIQCGK